MSLEELNKDCTNCKYFRSFMSIYDNDPMEPEEYGWCYFGGLRYNTPPDSDKEVVIGVGFSCKEYSENIDNR